MGIKASFLMINIPSINELWKKEQCPLVDGVIFEDGTVIEFSITNTPSGSLRFDEMRRTDLKEIFKQNPNNYKCLYHSNFEKIDGPYKYMAGEGSWGGDGYISCFDLKKNNVLWVFTSDKINPIIELDFLNDKIIAQNNDKSIFSIEVKNLTRKEVIIEQIENDH